MNLIVQWILAIALLVHDGHGYSRAMPRLLGDAIAAVAPDRDTAALLVVFAFRESSYRADVKGDYYADADGVVRPHSCGAWQTPCSRTPLCVASSGAKCFQAQAALAWSIMQASMVACPDYPLAVYASGNCTSLAGRRISTSRIAEARTLAMEP